MAACGPGQRQDPSSQAHMFSWVTFIQAHDFLQALLRLEGLVKGGAAAFDSFLDTLKTLQQVLTVQLNDRSALPPPLYAAHPAYADYTTAHHKAYFDRRLKSSSPILLLPSWYCIKCICHCWTL